MMTWLVPKLQVTLVEEHKTQSHKKRPFGHNLHSNLCNNLFCVKFDIFESFELHFLSTYIHTHTFHGIGSCFPKFYASSPTSFTLQFQLLNGQKNCFSAKLQRSRAIFHWLYCCQRKESFPRCSLCLSLNIYIYIYISLIVHLRF